MKNFQPCYRRTKPGELPAALRLRPGTPDMEKSDYVYILESTKDPRRHYTGFSESLEQRLAFHNAGGVPASAPYRPWRLKTFVAFTDRGRALEFERYLKSHSGRAFTIKRL